MPDHDPPAAAGLSRRSFLKTAAAGGAAAALGPSLWRRAAVAGTAYPEQVHLQFGADAATEMSVSWATAATVQRPRVRFGTASGGLGAGVDAVTRTYRESATGAEIYTHHASMSRLVPSTAYVYEVLHDGADPVKGTFTTGPAGRSPFRFTSFGDQGTGDQRDLVASPFGAFVVDQVEAKKPLFHLLNGDLCYGNLQLDPAAAWDRFFANNMRSARYRPWMPAAGNHENEKNNGPQGYAAYLTRFWLPDNAVDGFRGNWYAFTVGSVRVISLNNDDVCYQDGGSSYIRGYSAGAQRGWLEQTLAATRRDRAIDWIVVCMHQVVCSSANGNGCDLGIREEFAPLFDRYGVDVVVCGHEHDYERTHPVRGVDPDSATLRPHVISTRTDEIDTGRGTVHLVLGGGGTSVPTNTYGGTPGSPTAKVVTGKSTSATEDATWSAVRDPEYPYGFAVFDVDPGARPGGTTRMHVTYYRTPPSSTTAPTAYESFTLHRARRDAPGDYDGTPRSERSSEPRLLTTASRPPS